jgi:hypothetical protein
MDTNALCLLQQKSLHSEWKYSKFGRENDLPARSRWKRFSFTR